jgi:hypothetical protein
MKDFMFEHKQRSKNAIIELVELKKSIQWKRYFIFRKE